MKKVLLALCIALGLQQSAMAGYAEGAAAYKAKNYSAAIKELTPLAQKDHREAAYLLGLMNYTGQGVVQDYHQAGTWLGKAATLGQADAQYLLGTMYYTSKGMPQDYKQAAQWLRKAAQQGHADAQHLLGLMYLYQIGVPQKDMVLAYMLWNLSAAGGNSDAAELRGLLVKRMSAAQVEEAQTLSSAWKPGTALPGASKTGTE
jgi:TPR repeat protein